MQQRSMATAVTMRRYPDVHERAALLLAAALSVAGLLAGCAGGERQSDADRLVVDTEAGRLRGETLVDANVRIDRFLGVPYAEAPVGPLRWAPPRSPRRWSGVRDALTAPAACPQTLSGKGTVGDEDCLYLNVYRPAGTRRGASLPVMVYAYGGANTNGSANEVDGARLASDNGIIVVIPNYRLGALGFLNHPAIAPVDRGGNYGVLDTKAALAWTRANARAFGGDPGRVTLASQSSGSTNTCRLLVDPDAAGLFSAALLMSEDCVHDVDTPPEAVERARNLVREIGCAEDRDVAACLRGKPAAALAAVRGKGPQGSGWNPTAPESAAKSIAAGRWNAVPLLLGSTDAEGRSAGTAFTTFGDDDYRRWIARLVGAKSASTVLSTYAPDLYDGPFRIPYAVGDVVTDSGMRGLGGCTVLSMASEFARQAPTWAYQFEDPRPVPRQTRPKGYDFRASHGHDVPYVFPDGGEYAALTARWTAAQRELSDRMIRYWGAFVKNHDPAVAGQVAWPGVAAGGTLMALRPGDESRAVPLADVRKAHHCELWDRLPPVLDRGEP